MDNDDLFVGVALDTPQNVDTSVKDEIVTEGPSPTDIEWNDYVLGLFDENELYDGRPLCAGLRRVAELLLGRIVSSRPTQVFPPTEGDSIGRATVIWEVVFEDGSLFSDVADCWEGNTDDTFCVFNTATAATRAEGRALRKALRIKTVAAEEMTKKNTASIVRSISQAKEMANTDGEYNDSSRITDPQARFVDGKCKQLNIDVEVFFKEIFNADVKRKVTKSQASDAIRLLGGDYQKDKSLYANFMGYKPDWRD
jgi:hypothetical protein